MLALQQGNLGTVGAAGLEGLEVEKPLCLKRLQVVGLYQLNSDGGLMVPTPAGGMRVRRGGQLHSDIPCSAAAACAQHPPGCRGTGQPEGKTPFLKPTLGDTRTIAVYHERVLIRASMSFCFVLNNPVFGIETCQEPTDLARQIEKNKAVNHKGIHVVVNPRARCEKRGCPAVQIPVNALTKGPAAPRCLTQCFLK